jgi:DNA-binding transcriptional LysR family regulator
MELNQIRYFVTLARLLNFTRAAEYCNITQPALTKAVQKLEFELGGKLIHRERQLTQLTELGKLLLPTLQSLDAAANSARVTAREYQQKDNAPLKIGLTPCVSANLLVAPLSEVARVIPGIQVELIEEPLEHLFELLFEGKINAAVAADAVNPPERIDRWNLFEDRFLILSHRNSPLAEMQSIPVATLLDVTWLERTGCPLTQGFWDQCFTDERMPKVAHRSRHENHLQHLVEAGLGVMLSSEHTPMLPSLIARPIQDDPVRWNVSLLAVAGRRYTPALDAFIKVARVRNWNKTSRRVQRLA